MEREEAIKILMGYSHTPEERAALEVLIPELKESEDERIRKFLIEILSHGSWRKEWSFGPSEVVAWLEKQKESLHIPETCKENADSFTDEDERIRKWIYSIVENLGCPSDEDAEKELDEMQPLALAYLERQKKRGPLTKEEEYTLHRIIEYLEDETCPSEWISLLHDIYCLPYEKQKDLTTENIYKHSRERMSFWNGQQKEQKPNSTEDMPYITDEHFFEREPVDSFKYKLAEYMTRGCTKKEGPYGYEYGISAETILEMAEEELLKRGVVQKPAEWSEEDEKIYNSARDALYYKNCNDKDDVVEALQGLCNLISKHRKAIPVYARWKPSEEQMEALQHAIDACESEWAYQDDELRSLLNDLKKLI